MSLADRTETSDMTREEAIKVLECIYSNGWSGYPCDFPGDCLISDTCKQAYPQLKKMVDQYFANSTISIEET